MTIFLLAEIPPQSLIFAGGGFIVGAAIIAIARLYNAKVRRKAVDSEIVALRATAEADAKKIGAVAEAESKSKFITMREQFDKDTEQSRREIKGEEKRLSKREDTIEQKMETVSSKERNVETAQRAVNEKEKSLVSKDQHLKELIAQQKTQLMKVAQMNPEEAKKRVLEIANKEAEIDKARIIDKMLGEARETAETEAREVILQAIQRYASDHTSEHTVSAIDIPSDDMKGRIIGREGRNIRAFEKATGVDVIVDDTPGVIVCSSFDPVRREIARRSLERLIADGRIHPSRIESVVENVEKEIEKEISTAGKNAMMEANVSGLHPKLIELLGRLQFRTSYGQNVLMHSMEVARLSQVMADLLGLSGQVARRAGLLHDIGKAVDHEVEGGHPQIGADLLKRYGEKEEIINAAAAHHGDIEAYSAYTPIVQAADAMSASRPGARRESLERYVQRLEKLEAIATAFEGVKQAHAIQAGREVRVIVDPENVDDRLTQKIAHDIAKRVEEEMEYPGEVKVTLIREVRCTDYAR